MVFAGSCATSGCHDGHTTPNLKASANLFSSLSGTSANRGCSTRFIDTANPDNSAIIKSIQGTCGALKMPVGGWKGITEADALSCIKKWIASGGK